MRPSRIPLPGVAIGAAVVLAVFLLAPGAVGSAHPAWTSGSYSPAFFMGLHLASSSALAGRTLTTVFAHFVTPDDHDGGVYSAYEGAWNMTLVAYGVGTTGPASSSAAFFSVGLTSDTYGTFYPVWSDKHLTGTTATCQAGGQSVASNHGFGTTSLFRATDYNFSMTFGSGTSVTYAITTAAGSAVWSLSNSTGTLQSYAGFGSAATGVACPVSGTQSGFYHVQMGEQVSSTQFQAQPPYDFYAYTLGGTDTVGTLRITDVSDVSFSANSAPSGIGAVSSMQGSPFYDYGRLNNIPFSTAFGPISGLPNSLLTAGSVAANGHATFGGLVLKTVSTSPSAYIVFSWVGSGLTAATCATGCSTTTPTFFWNVTVTGSATSGSTAYLYVNVYDAGNTVQTEAVIFINVV